jgi:aquaporin Z
VDATTLDIQARSAAVNALAAHWRLYLMEVALLSLFMISACGFGILLEHPASAVRQAIENPLTRRALMGMAMGVTAVVLIYSRWGRRSGAHMNPAVTLSFLRLGRIEPWDAMFYIAAQCIGGVLGVLAAAAVWPESIRDPLVNYVVTAPGIGRSLAIAWAAEFTIAFLMMFTVLTVNAQPRLAPYSGCFAAALLVLYITFEAPLSGMSLNPARTLASALPAGQWTGWWVYLTAPVLGMFAAIEVIAAMRRGRQTLCGRLNHSRRVPGIFRCNCFG